MYDVILPLIFAALFGATAICLLSKNRRLIEISSIIASGIALIGSVFVALQISQTGSYAPISFFYIDSLGAVTMLIISVVGFFATLYSVAYLKQETSKNIIGSTGVQSVYSRVREYFILLNLFMAMMFLTIAVSNPILAWIFIEATTLSTAFLISFYNKPGIFRNSFIPLPTGVVRWRRTYHMEFACRKCRHI